MDGDRITGDHGSRVSIGVFTDLERLVQNLE
jgi:hypothetical protein